MNKESVLALCKDEKQKSRVQSVYMVSERFKTVPVFEKLSTKGEVEKEIALLVVNYEKRVEAKKKLRARKKLKQDTIDELMQLMTQAKEIGLDDDFILFSIKKLIKDQYNAKLLQQIQELQDKMIK